MSATRPKISANATAADAAGMSVRSTSGPLEERLAVLEQEKLSLLKIICELLTKNEELRSQIRDEALRGLRAS